MNIVGQKSTGTEFLSGTASDDVIYSLGGSDFVDGKAGFDVMVIEWVSTGFSISTVDGTTYLDALSGASGADRVVVRNVELLQFQDRNVSLESNDVYVDSAAGEVFNGGPGTDTVVYSGIRSNYTVAFDPFGIDVRPANGAPGADWLVDIERVKFADVGLAFDVGKSAGVVARTVGTVFGADAVNNAAYMGIGLYHMDTLGFSAAALMRFALEARLGSSTPDPRVAVDLIYLNVIGVPANDETRDHYVGLVERGEQSIAGLALMASQLPELEGRINLPEIGLVGLQYVEWTPPELA